MVPGQDANSTELVSVYFFSEREGQAPERFETLLMKHLLFCRIRALQPEPQKRMTRDRQRELSQGLVDPLGASRRFQPMPRSWKY